MNKKELRLGNFVKWEGAERILEVTEIKPDCVYLHSNKQMTRVYLTFDRVQPIPLTSQMFWKIFQIPFNEDKFRGNSRDLLFQILFNWKVVAYSHIIKQLKSVHELQNLYFDLTGEELNITEEMLTEKARMIGLEEHFNNEKKKNEIDVSRGLLSEETMKDFLNSGGVTYTKQGWTKFSDKMPEVNQKIIVYTTEGVSYIEYQHDIYIPLDISYWMPIALPVKTTKKTFEVEYDNDYLIIDEYIIKSSIDKSIHGDKRKYVKVREI